MKSIDVLVVNYILERRMVLQKLEAQIVSAIDFSPIIESDEQVVEFQGVIGGNHGESKYLLLYLFLLLRVNHFYDLNRQIHFH